MTPLGIFRLEAAIPGMLPLVHANHHTISMSADGMYVYLVLADGSGFPVTFRVDYDLSSKQVIYQPGAGTFGCVQADWNHGNRLWVCDDAGAANKVVLSEDWGETFTDMTGAGWGANLVRPVLPSAWKPSDVLMNLNTASQMYHSKNTGQDWVNTGAAPFNMRCMERDYLEPMNVFAGSGPANADDLYWSPNLGVHWYDRRTQAAAVRLISIQVVG